MSIDIKFDLNQLLKSTTDITDQIKSELEKATATLAQATHNHIKEQAEAKLNSRKDMYIDALSMEQVDDNVYEITLDPSAEWIEVGMEPHEMIDDLLTSSKTKTAKDGSKYLVIPFKHDNKPKKSSSMQKRMQKEIKTLLRQNKIPYRQIERHASGKPKTGLLHKLSTHKPTSSNPSPGFQGPADRHFSTNQRPHGREGAEGRPYLWDMRIYQRHVFDKSGNPVFGKDGHQKVKREIFTFRVVSSKQKGTGMWYHPGSPGVNFFEEAIEWAEKEWDTKIMPELLSKIK